MQPIAITSYHRSSMTLRIVTIVPTYQRPNAVLEAIECIAGQTRTPDELIIIDDASTDDTPRRIDAWLTQRRLPFPARLIRQPENQGCSAARNRGIKAAAGCCACSPTARC